jgi:peroxiredoxin
MMQRFRTPEEIDAKLDSLGAMPANVFADRLRERRDFLAKSAVGSPAPDFTLNRPDGTPFTLSSLRGKFVILVFWGYDIQDYNYQAISNLYFWLSSRGLQIEIVGVSPNRGKGSWLEEIKYNEDEWIEVMDLPTDLSNADQVTQQYSVQNLPYDVLIDPYGVIIGRNLNEYDEYLAKIAESLLN